MGSVKTFIPVLTYLYGTTYHQNPAVVEMLPSANMVEPIVRAGCRKEYVELGDYEALENKLKRAERERDGWLKDLIDYQTCKVIPSQTTAKIRELEGQIEALTYTINSSGIEHYKARIKELEGKLATAERSISECLKCQELKKLKKEGKEKDLKIQCLEGQLRSAQDTLKQTNKEKAAILRGAQYARQAIADTCKEAGANPDVSGVYLKLW